MILILGSAFVLGVLYQYFGKQLDGELEKEASYLAYGVEQSGVDYLEQIKQKDARITYMDASGTVLYDSQADASSMENHNDRKEVQEALENGSGYAERMSKTLSEKTVYYALKLTNGSVLRVAGTQSSVFALMLQLVPPVLCIVVIMLILAGFAAARMSANIVKPINELDLDHPEENQIYEEVGPLLSRIHKQNRQIQTQLETARRNQEEFQIITENMQEGLLVIDAYTIILSGNSSVWRMFQVREPKIGESVYSLDRNEDFRKVIEEVMLDLHAASKKMGMSYSKCWKLLNRAEEQMGFTFLDRYNGGPHGGNSRITEEGREFMRRYEALLEEMKEMSQKAFEKYFKEYFKEYL